MTTTNHIREDKIENLNELIAVTRDSAEFYGHAAEKASNPELRELFQQMAASKNGLIGDMSREVKVEGAKPEQEGTFRGTMNRMYGDIRAKLGNADYGYVAQLEASEDRMLHAFNDVLEDKDTPASVCAVVRKHLPLVKQQHDLMRDRKRAMEATKH